MLISHVEGFWHVTTPHSTFVQAGELRAVLVRGEKWQSI